MKKNYFSEIKKYIVLFLLFLIQFSYSQQYPVRIVPNLMQPYSLKLGDYATSTDNKLQLIILMTDLMEPQHQTGLKFSLEAGLNAVPYAQSNDFVVGMQPFTLYPGSNLTLTNIDVRALFELQNLNGINALQYAQPLSDGVYRFCFQAYDFYTKRNLSDKTCTTVFLVQYEPPMLNLPQRGEKVIKQGEFQNLVFQWMPRQIAPNTRYIFTLKELWDVERDPISGFLSSPPLWREETYAPTLYYGIDKTQLIAGKRYAWQVQAKSGNPVFDANPTEDNGVYRNNGLSEIFYFDYVENCAVPTLLMAKNAGRGRVELSWNLAGQPSGLYTVQYRKRGSSSDWQTEKSYQPRYIVTGLEDQTEYEYRIGSVCGNLQTFNNTNPITDGDSAGNAYAYSGVQYFTTDSKDKTNQNYQCGVMPAVDIANREPLRQLLGANEVFTAGDFPVTVISAQGSNGIYSGTGYIVVPYLEKTKVKVSFNNIKINTDKKLIEGVVETTYDPTEKNIIEVHIIKSIGDILKDVLGIISKDNPTDEDKQTYEAFKQQWNFYLSNIDDINMPPADKAKFEEIKKNLFSASTLPMSAEDKAKAIEAAKEAQKLYEKYKAEFDKLKEKNNTYTNVLEQIKSGKILPPKSTNADGVEKEGNAITVAKLRDIQGYCTQHQDESEVWTKVKYNNPPYNGYSVCTYDKEPTLFYIYEGENYWLVSEKWYTECYTNEISSNNSSAYGCIKVYNELEKKYVFANLELGQSAGEQTADFLTWLFIRDIPLTIVGGGTSVYAAITNLTAVPMLDYLEYNGTIDTKENLALQIVLVVAEHGKVKLSPSQIKEAAQQLAEKFKAMKKTVPELIEDMKTSLRTLAGKTERIFKVGDKIADIAIDRIKLGTNGKIAVIGRAMGNESIKGVRDVYKELVTNGYKNVEIFDKSVLTDSWLDKFLEAEIEMSQKVADNGGKWLDNNQIITTKMYKLNKEWAQYLVDEGYEVIDMGDIYYKTGNDRGFSVFYSMEKSIIFKK